MLSKIKEVKVGNLVDYMHKAIEGVCADDRVPFDREKAQRCGSQALNSEDSGWACNPV